MEQEIDVCRGEERAEPKGNALCLPSDLCFPTFTFDHELWIQAATMSFLCRTAGLVLRDERLRVEPLLLHI